MSKNERLISVRPDTYRKLKELKHDMSFDGLINVLLKTNHIKTKKKTITVINTDDIPEYG